METGQLIKSVGDCVPAEQVAPAMNTDPLIQRAIDGNIDIEKLQAVINMRERELERQARAAFAFHFGQAQREIPPIKKDKEAKDARTGKKLYNYASLDNIMDIVRPILARHGFAVRWTDTRAGDSERTITCHISGWGWEESSSVDIPVQSATTYTNPLQQRGSSSSYGRRYSLINALGLQIEGEDDDGAAAFGIEDQLRLASEIAELSSAKTVEMLGDTFRKLWRRFEAEEDKRALAVLSEAKDRLKSEFAAQAKA